MSSESPRFSSVKCLSPAGFHRMAYAEWGDPDNPNVVLCVHGLTRVGRDFDVLARALSGQFRVVCPDVVGRGASEWLRDARYYDIPQYAADMATLIARLDVDGVMWVGTSMGGLIGIAVAGQPGAPIRKFVINDVGPTLNSAAIQRIGEYLGRPLRFDSVEAAVDYVSTVAAPFGLKTRAEWRAITETTIRRDGDGWVLHYDPRIAEPFKGVTPEGAARAEAATWALWDNIRCPTLLTRGAQSDLLSSDTAAQMSRRGPGAKLVEFAGVGHAPMFMHDDQISVVRDFLLNG
ncbi:MAG: alpha/beta fold hydrolase [Gemmatimonadota bacterium]